MGIAVKHLVILGAIAGMAGCSSGSTVTTTNSSTTVLLGAVPDPNDYSTTLTTLTTATPTDPTTLTQQTNLPTGSATYYGVASLTLSGNVTTFYLGGVTADIDFGAKTVTGDIDDFRKKTTSSSTLTTVAGSLDFVDTVLTGNNTSGVGSGIAGSAEGTVDGVDLDMTVAGAFFGTDGDNVSLTFADASTNSGGVAYLTE